MSSNEETSSTVSNPSGNPSFQERFLRLTNFDCIFEVGAEGKVITGHKFLFSAASDVFRAIFSGELGNGEQFVVEDINPEEFQCMKQFFYTGEVEFLSNNLALLTYIAARKYKVSPLVEKCEQFISENLGATSVLEFFELCQSSNILDFDEMCTKIIQEKTVDVLESEYYLTTKPATIEKILQSPVLNLESEIEVFENFQRWAVAEAGRVGISTSDIATNFNQLKKYIRFLTIPANQFHSNLGKSPLLTQEERDAIAFNQLNPDSTSIPENLSPERKKREFIIPKSKKYPYKHTFQVDTHNNLEVYNNQLITKLFDVNLHVKYSHSGNEPFNIISFEVLAESRYNIHRLMKMNFQLKVSGSENSREIVIKNFCYILVTPQVKIGTVWSCQKVTFATLSVRQLSDFVNEKDKVNVVLLCDFEKVES